MSETTMQAEREQEDRAAAAQRRARGEPTRVADLLGGLERARAKQQQRRLTVREDDCPSCRVDSPKAKACLFRGEEMCAHRDELAKRARARVLEANLRAGDVPPGRNGETHAKLLSGEYEATAAVAAARRLIAEEGKLAVFAGGTGSGKSFGASLVIAERGGSFISASMLDPYGREVNELIEHCLAVSVLAIDDVGSGQSASDNARKRIEQIVCSRFDAGRATVLTTNLAQAAFWPLYGGQLGRIADRLFSDPIAWVRCLEESQRRNPPPPTEVDR